MAENQCRKRRTDDWTMQVEELRLNLAVLCQIQYKLKKNLPITHLMEQATAADIVIPQPTEISKTINRLKSKLKEYRKESPSIREQFMKSQAALHDAKGDNKSARKVRAILRAENKLKAYKIYKNMAGKTIQTQSFNKVSIPLTWKQFE